MKLDFEGETRPEKVFIGMMSYVAHPYVRAPLRCFRCQRLGHMASGCTASIRCLVCAGEHDKEVCTTLVKRCANCNGPHAANSKECKFIRQGKEIEKLKSVGMSFRDAVKQCKVDTNNTGRLNAGYEEMERGFPRNRDREKQQGSFSISNREGVVNDTEEISSQDNLTSVSTQYSTILRTKPRNPQWIEKNKRKNVPEISDSPLDSTTDLVYKMIEYFEKEMKKLMEEMYRSIGKFVKELFTYKLQEEGMQQRNLIIAGLVRNHFGKEIGEEMYQEVTQVVGLRGEKGESTEGKGNSNNCKDKAKEMGSQNKNTVSESKKGKFKFAHRNK